MVNSAPPVPSAPEPSDQEPIGHVVFRKSRRAPDVDWALDRDVTNGMPLFASPEAAAEEPIRLAYKTGYDEGYADGSDGLVDHDACEEGWQQYRETLALPASPEPATQGAAKPVHTDHPFQHWDRTCPACVLEASPPVPNSATQGAAEPVKYTRDFGDYATEDVMAWIDAELARCDAPMGEGLPYIPADKDVGDALRWLRANLFGISAASPAPEPLTPAAGGPDERVLNLLARIHRDGGHYVAEHGLHKALQDAEGIVIERIATLDEIAALTTATHGLSEADSAKEASDEWFHEDSLELVGWKYHGKGDGEGTFRLITPNDTYNPDQVTPGSMVPVYARLSGSPVQPAVRGDAEALRDAHLYGFVCVPDPSVPHDQAVFKLNGREIGRVANIDAAIAQTPEGKDET